MVEPDLADPSKKTEVPSGPHPLLSERPSGLPDEPAQTRDEPVADPPIPVTAPAGTGPDTGTALATTTSPRTAFARRPTNKGTTTHNKSKQTHAEKQEKHRLRLIAKAAAATAAGTSSAEEDGDDDDDGDKHSKNDHSDEDSDADDASEQDVDASLTTQPTTSRTEPAPTPGKKASPASSKTHSPSHGGGAPPGRPSNPFAALDEAAKTSRRRSSAPSASRGDVPLDPTQTGTGGSAAARAAPAETTARTAAVATSPAPDPAPGPGPADARLQAPPAAPPSPVPPEGGGSTHDGFQPARPLTGLHGPNPLPASIRDANHATGPIDTILYYEPNPLGREVARDSPLRASSLTAFEHATLTFTTSGIDGTRGAHVELSSAPLGIRRLILHWQAFGPILPFNEVFGGTPDPDVGYSERYGYHLRRGLVIRFPPGSGTIVMDQWNSHRSTLAAGERASSHPNRPQTVGLFDITNNPDGTCKFYLMSHELLPTGDTYAMPGVQDQWQISRGKRVVLSLSSTETHPPTISIRPDNSRAAEECFPLDLCTFTVRETPKAGRPGGAGGPARFGHRRPPMDTSFVLTVDIGSAPRTIIFSLLFNPHGEAPRANDLLRLCNRRVAAAKGMMIVAPRGGVPDASDGDALMAEDGAVAAGQAAPAGLIPLHAPALPNALTTLVASFTAPSTDPRVIVLGDSIHSESFGKAIQSAASNMKVTTVQFPDVSLNGMISIYLAAHTQRPMEIEELVIFAPMEALARIAALPSARRDELENIHTAIQELADDLSQAIVLVHPPSDARGGDGSTRGTRTLSLYLWTANEKDSTMGWVTNRLLTKLDSMWKDDPNVRICSQFYNVKLDLMQQTATAAWDKDLRDKFLIKHPVNGSEQWSAAANAIFASIVGSNTLINYKARLARRNARRLFAVTDTTSSTRTVAPSLLYSSVYDHNIFIGERTSDTTYAVIDQLTRGDGEGIDRIVGAISIGWMHNPGVGTLHTSAPSSDLSALRALLEGGSSSELRLCDVGDAPFAPAHVIAYGCLEQARQLNHTIRGAMNPIVMEMLAQYGTDGPLTREAMRHVTHPHLFAAKFAACIRDCARAMGSTPHELSDVWEALAPPSYNTQFTLSENLTLGLIEMDDADEDSLLDGHSTNLDRIRGKIAKATGEFTVHRWELAAEGITSLESATRLTDPGGEPPSKRPKLSTREKLIARAKLKSRGSSSSSSTATADGHATPNNHRLWQPHPSGDDSDVRFAASVVGAPYLLLRVAPGSKLALVHGTQYAQGVIPHHGPSQEIVPEPPCEFTPFSPDDPLLVNESANTDGTVAPPTSSYQWIQRYVSRYPGHIVIISRKSESGRSYYATITRASAPTIQPAPPLAATGTAGEGGAIPEALMEVATTGRFSHLVAHAASAMDERIVDGHGRSLMRRWIPHAAPAMDGHAADGHGRAPPLRAPAQMHDNDDAFLDDGDDDDDEPKSPPPDTDGHGRAPPLRAPAQMHDDDDVFLDDGDDDDDEPKSPPPDTDEDEDMGAAPARVKTAATSRQIPTTIPSAPTTRRGSPTPSSPARGRRFRLGQVAGNRQLTPPLQW